MKVIDKQTGKELTKAEILKEINRDRSEEWQDYVMEDFETMPEDLVDWIDPQYYEVVL
jgi:hypothetical protein